MKIDDRMKDAISAGVDMIMWAKQGKTKEFMWKELGRMGFSEKERVDIAKTVNSFMQHKQGNHKDCPSMCDQVETLSSIKRSKNMSIQDVADMIEERHELHDSCSFSKDIQEEWK